MAGFSWGAFSDKVVIALASDEGFRAPDADAARQWLDERVGEPSTNFVHRTKDVLDKVWLPEYRGARRVVQELQDLGLGPGGRPRSQRAYSEYVQKCRRSPNLHAVLRNALLRVGRQDSAGDDRWIRPLAILNPATQPRPNQALFDHQREAHQRLDEHHEASRKSGRFQGILQMPTGAGKTLTAVRWLSERVLSERHRIIWLAHRHELLEQAALAFYQEAARVERRERLRIRVVSGRHCPTSQMDLEDDVLICSVNSLARNLDVARDFLREPDTFVVVDEAHHSPAATYRKLLDLLGVRRTTARWNLFDGRQRFRLLGLTATPTRTDEHERKILAELFGGNTLYRVEPSRLVREGILARPFAVDVPTQTDLDRMVTEDDRRYLRRFHDLSEGLLQRIGGLRHRNELILTEYREHRTRYGQTLVFATSLAHAQALAELFRANGVAADHVGSDRASVENDVAMEAFRNKTVQVLVNVQKITEGVDLPGVETVFLARPTTSEILFTQMVGRALRGPRAGGTEKAWLVSFSDHWSEVQDWMTPARLLSDILEPFEAPPEVPKETAPPKQGVPRDVVVELLRKRADFPVTNQAERFEAVPLGFYELGPGTTILVYEHQCAFWDTLLRGADNLEQAFEHFEDCDPPRPARSDIERAWAHLQGGGVLLLQEFEDARTCHPTEIARLILQDDLGERARMAMLRERYTDLSRTVYGSFGAFRHAVDEQILALQDPKEVAGTGHSSPVFEDLPGEPLAPGPHHDLPTLWSEMLVLGAPLLGRDRLTYTGRGPEWTRRIIKGWFGKANWEEGDEIWVNRLLDSPNISAETIRFLLWHEFLHIHLRLKHPPEFRRLERLWPDYTRANRELDTLQERFAISWW